MNRFYEIFRNGKQLKIFTDTELKCDVATENH